MEPNSVAILIFWSELPAAREIEGSVATYELTPAV